MSISEIRNPLLRRAVLLAIMPLWLPLMLLISAGIGIAESADEIIDALRDGWRGSR